VTDWLHAGYRDFYYVAARAFLPYDSIASMLGE